MNKGYLQVIDNMAYHLSLMMFQDEEGIFAMGKSHPEFGDDIRQLDKIAAVAARTYLVDIEALMDQVMEQVDERLAMLYLQQVLISP